MVVYELLDETMDFGYPQTCESKILREYVTAFLLSYFPFVMLCCAYSSLITSSSTHSTSHPRPHSLSYSPFHPPSPSPSSTLPPILPLTLTLPLSPSSSLTLPPSPSLSHPPSLTLSSSLLSLPSRRGGADWVLETY